MLWKAEDDVFRGSGAITSHVSAIEGKLGVDKRKKRWGVTYMEPEKIDAAVDAFDGVQEVRLKDKRVVRMV